MEIATLIVNRNAPAMTDDLVQRMKALMRARPRDIYVLESGSDIDNISHATSVWMRENVNWPMGFNILIDYARRHKRRHAKRDYDAFWCVCNDTQLVDDVDPWAVMEKALEKVPDWGVAHPFQHYFQKGHPGFPLNKQGTGARRVSFVEFVCPLIRSRLLECYNSTTASLIDERYSRGWGIDYELAYYAHLAGFGVYNIDDVGVLHIPNTSHKDHQATKTEDVDTFLTTARVEMLNEMVKKHGPSWGEKFCEVIPDLPDRVFRNWSHSDREVSKTWRPA